MILFIALLGALMNKIRGGIIADIYARYLLTKGYEWKEALEKAEGLFKTLGKQSHHIVFALVFAPIVVTNNSANWIDVVILYIAMYAGQSIGWQQYITGLIEKRITDKSQVEIIDAIAIDTLPNQPILANTFALSLRGMLWSFCIFIGFFVVSMINFVEIENLLQIFYSGAIMGPAYLLAMEIAQRLKGFSRGNGQQFGEYFTGFFFWGTWAFLLGA